ncbi:MAG: glycosyltransferase family protein [Acidimicrobiales bacterium]
MSSTATKLRRVLLYAHDTYGLGHLRRNLAIAGRLLEDRPGLQVMLMTGSPVADRFPMPQGLALVRLPPVVKVGAEDYRPRDPRWDIDLVRRARSAIMADAARRFRPDVFLVDHAPQGMKAELLPVYATLRSASPAARIVLGLRDVLDDPVSVQRTWSEQGAYETLDTVFDRILVYGSADLLDVVSAYGLSSAVAAKLTYCGYVCRPTAGLGSGPKDGEAFVLGTAGGGGDGTEVLSATLAASTSLGVRSRVVTGPLMSEADRLVLARQAASDAAAEVTEFVPDMSDAMRRASAVVTMGGYNSLCELVASGTPTVVVPRIHPRREQAIRAELFARRGVVSVVEPGPDLSTRLQEALAIALAAGRRLGPSGLELDGLDRLDEAVEAEARWSRVRSSTGRRPSITHPRVRTSA